MTVQRYALDQDALTFRADMCEDEMMLPSETGGYVKFDDYQELQDEYTDLKIMYNRLVEDIGNLYKEA